MAGYVSINMDPHAEQPPPSQAAAEEEEDGGKFAGPFAKAKETEVENEDVHGGSAEEEPLINHIYECRICQDEDNVLNLETPCGCSGSLKYAHRKCVQYWCNEKGDTICEICHKAYQPGYTAPTRPPLCEETAIDIRGRLAINVNPILFELNDPRLLAMPEVDRRFLETEYDDYPNANIEATGAELCRSVTFILMAILLLRHIFTAGGTSDDDDDFDLITFFGLFFLKVAAFLLPCYIMAWTITLIARQKERQAAAEATTPFAFVLQSAHSGDLHLTIATPPHPARPQEPQ